MTTRELEKLRDKLPPKFADELHRRLSNQTISNIRAVLRGSHNNDEIIDAAIALAEEHQNNIKARSEKIRQL